MSKETMLIAFPNGGILPADITGGAERRVGPHEAVEVPFAYGDHLVNDRFAYEAKPPRKSAARAKLEKRIAELQAGLDRATKPEDKAKLEGEIAKARAALVELASD